LVVVTAEISRFGVFELTETVIATVSVETDTPTPDTLACKCNTLATANGAVAAVVPRTELDAPVKPKIVVDPPLQLPEPEVFHAAAHDFKVTEMPLSESPDIDWSSV
jgi:hypothetical protein